MKSVYTGVSPQNYSMSTDANSSSDEVTPQAQNSHYDDLSPSRLSHNSHLKLDQLASQKDPDHKIIASQLRNALQDGILKLESHNGNEATYQASVCMPEDANVRAAANADETKLTIQTTRINDQSYYEVVTAHLNRYLKPIFVKFSELSTVPKKSQVSTASSERALLGSNRSILRYTVPPKETEDQCVLVIDKIPPPKNGEMSFFRATNDLSMLPRGMEKEGLFDLKLAGCERISSVDQVRNIREALGNGPLTVLDLREESHAIVNGLPVTLRGPMDWANVGLTKGQRDAHENAMIEKLKQSEAVTLVDANFVKGKKHDPQTTIVKNVQVKSEQEIVIAADANYRRAAITDHNRPSPEATDELVSIMSDCLQKNEAIVVHCNGGRGRTTTAMTMVDMLKNARSHSAETIIERMAKLSYDYNMTDLERVSARKRPLLQDRLEFLHAFHDYARHNPGGLPLKWTEWRVKVMAEQTPTFID